MSFWYMFGLAKSEINAQNCCSLLVGMASGIILVSLKVSIPHYLHCMQAMSRQGLLLACTYLVLGQCVIVPNTFIVVSTALVAHC